MAGKTRRPALVISADEGERLERLRDSRKAPKREVERAAILLRYAAGEGPAAIQQALGVSRPTIYKCIDKALAAGVEAGLKDRYHRPKEPVITEQEKAWVLNIACTKPTDHGLAAELWTLSSLARYTREHAPTVSVAASEAGTPLPGVSAIRCAVNPLLKSAVPEICMRRSVGTEGG